MKNPDHIEPGDIVDIEQSPQLVSMECCLVLSLPSSLGEAWIVRTDAGKIAYLYNVLTVYLRRKGIA